ncbi:MAG TPA: hypothetical protein VGD72_09370 [Mycobacteriales bacterium]
MGVLPKELVKPLGELVHLRNYGAHGDAFDVTPAHAALYVAVAAAAVEVIDGSLSGSRQDNTSREAETPWAL